MKIKKRSCKNCHSPFKPDKYNHPKQEYCSKPECKLIAVKEKRAKYRNKKKWDLEFRADEVKRVQKWRLKNPGYDHKKAKIAGLGKPTLSDSKDSDLDSPRTPNEVDVLRDLVIRQELITVGMASQFVGEIPENVESFLLNCCNAGRIFSPFSNSATNLFPSSKILLDKKNEKNIEKISPEFCVTGLRSREKSAVTGPLFSTTS